MIMFIMIIVVFHASEGHLVPSHLGLAYALFADTNTFPAFVMLFSNFAIRAFNGTFSILGLPYKIVWRLKDMVNTLYLLSRFVCINSDQNFHYSSYLQSVIANVNNRSLHCRWQIGNSMRTNLT